MRWVGRSYYHSYGWVWTPGARPLDYGYDFLRPTKRAYQRMEIVKDAR